MTSSCFLAADIGGTNVRMGAYENGHLVHSATHSTKAGVPLLDLLHRFSEDMAARPEVIVVAAAGPVSNNSVKLTNANQTLCGAELKQATGARHAHIINDFAAAAWATLAPEGDNLLVLQGAAEPPEGTRMVIGPGTGLGVGALALHRGQYASVPGEGGHVGIAPHNAFETEVFSAFRSIWPEVFFGDTLMLEAEGMLSGTGLPPLYQAVSRVLTGSDTHLEAGEIMHRAQAKTDPVAIRTIEIFKAHLAQVAGDLALTFGAEAGVFLVGGVAMKNAWLFDEAFVEDFCQGGRFTEKRRKLNLYLLNIENFGLHGAFNYAKHVVGNSQG